MQNWIHPTGKAPETVTLVCLGASHQSFIDCAFDRDTPDWLLQSEVWTLNRGALAFRAHVAFVLDYLDGESAAFPHYAASLYRLNIPIITSEPAPDWPNHVHAYPFAAVWQWLTETLQPQHSNWLINSVPLILLYAGYIGVKTIRVFGADYQGHSQREEGHACAAYWAGILERVGLRVEVPDTTQFLGGNCRYTYGYQYDPHPSAVAKRARFQALTER
jgi:hypothetical protein